MKKRIMILGAGHFQLPAIKRANELGCQTVVLSNIKDDPGFAFAGKSYFSSTVEKEKVYEIARQEKISGIMTIASEIAAPSVAYVCEKMDLPGVSYETAMTVSNKYRLRSFLQKNKIENIGFGLARNVEEALAVYERLEKPVMIKPLISSGSKGVKRIHTRDELVKHIERTIGESFFCKGAILEEYMEGILLGGEIIVQNGKIILACISEKNINDLFVTSGHLFPATITEDDKEQVLGLLKKIVTCLSFKYGAMDLDLMLTDKGPKIIELGGRLGGNGISELACYHTNVDIIKETIKIAMGEGEDKILRNENIPAAISIVGSKKCGLLKRFYTFNEKMPDYTQHLLQERQFVSTNSRVHKFTQGNYQLGHYMVKHETTPRLKDLIRSVASIDWIQVE